MQYRCEILVATPGLCKDLQRNSVHVGRAQSGESGPSVVCEMIPGGQSWSQMMSVGLMDKEGPMQVVGCYINRSKSVSGRDRAQTETMWVPHTSAVSSSALGHAPALIRLPSAKDHEVAYEQGESLSIVLSNRKQKQRGKEK